MQPNELFAARMEAVRDELRQRYAAAELEIERTTKYEKMLDAVADRNGIYICEWCADYIFPHNQPDGFFDGNDEGPDEDGNGGWVPCCIHCVTRFSELPQKYHLLKIDGQPMTASDAMKILTTHRLAGGDADEFLPSGYGLERDEKLLKLEGASDVTYA